MRLERSPAWLVATPVELPTEEAFVANARQVVSTLKQLREAPVVDEEYRGPVMLSPDASSDVLATLIGENAAGRKTMPGRGGRTMGQFASAFKSRVLPPFITVVDDPTQSTFQGHSLTGSYKFDDDGVKRGAGDGDRERAARKLFNWAAADSRLPCFQRTRSGSAGWRAATALWRADAARK